MSWVWSFREVSNGYTSPVKLCFHPLQAFFKRLTNGMLDPYGLVCLNANYQPLNA